MFIENLSPFWYSRLVPQGDKETLNFWSDDAFLDLPADIFMPHLDLDFYFRKHLLETQLPQKDPKVGTNTKNKA